MSSRKKRNQTKKKSVPTLDLSFKSFNMIDGEFKGGKITFYSRNPHGRWAIQYFIRYGSSQGQFRCGHSYIDEVEFFKCVEQTPELKQFTRDLALKKLLC